MADSPDPSGFSPLLKAAERMERMMRSTKEKQVAETRSRLLPEAPETPRPDPAKEWARKHAVRTIRGMAKPAEAPAEPLLTPPAQQGESAPQTATPAAPAFDAPQKMQGNSGHIGASLGKPAPRKGLIGRLFRGP